MAKKKIPEKKMLYGRQIDTSMSRYDFSGSINDVISRALVLKTEYELAGWSNIKIDWDSDWDNNWYYYVTGDRWETDQEFENRIRTEEKAKANKKRAAKAKAEYERKEYERLKAKFEKVKNIVKP